MIINFNLRFKLVAYSLDFQKRKQFGLLIDDTEDYDSYDDTMNPGIHHGFSTAAFRFGHSLVQDNVELRDETYELREELSLRDTYLNPSLLYNGGLDDVIRGMLGQKAQDVHRYTTEEFVDVCCTMHCVLELFIQHSLHSRSSTPVATTGK
ncbi:UNVERIFIED_CONTAM: Tpo [Trichonephila clavipes]